MGRHRWVCPGLGQPGASWLGPAGHFIIWWSTAGPTRLNLRRWAVARPGTRRFQKMGHNPAHRINVYGCWAGAGSGPAHQMFNFSRSCSARVLSNLGPVRSKPRAVGMSGLALMGRPVVRPGRVDPVRPITY